MTRGDDRAEDAANAAAAGYAHAKQLTSRPDVSAWAPASARPPGFASSPPWNAAAAYVMHGIHDGVRRVEAELRAQAGLPARDRGGSDANTAAALDAICDLVVAVADHQWAVEALEHWANQADLLPGVDEAFRWEPLPRVAGQPPMTCPYCGLPSLRCAPSRRLVMCRTVRCADANGRRPVASADVSRIDASPVLAWADGLVTGPR